MQKAGKLHRFDLAFSRDQAEKIYVQQRMKEQARELWAWLQGGAYFYVCGDAHRMAKDVHQALIDIARQEGGLTPEAAEAYVNGTLMKTERRYLRARMRECSTDEHQDVLRKEAPCQLQR